MYPKIKSRAMKFLAKIYQNLKLVIEKENQGVVSQSSIRNYPEGEPARTYLICDAAGEGQYGNEGSFE